MGLSITCRHKSELWFFGYTAEVFASDLAPGIPTPVTSILTVLRGDICPLGSTALAAWLVPLIARLTDVACQKPMQAFGVGRSPLVGGRYQRWIPS